MFLLGLSPHPATFGVRFDSLKKKNTREGSLERGFSLSGYMKFGSSGLVFSYLRIEGFGKRE